MGRQFSMDFVYHFASCLFVLHYRLPFQGCLYHESSGKIEIVSLSEVNGRHAYYPLWKIWVFYAQGSFL